jgi:hypothetical protein
MNNILQIEQLSSAENISSTTNKPLISKKPEMEPEDHPKPNEPKEPDTISQVFKEEFGLIWKTFKFVLRGWAEFPQKM